MQIRVPSMYTWQLVKTKDKPCSKAMGIHLAHNIRIRLEWLKKLFLLPDLAPLDLLLFSMSVCGKWAWSPSDNATDFPAPKSWVSELFVEIVCFCTSNGSFGILKKAWEFFSKDGFLLYFKLEFFSLQQAEKSNWGKNPVHQTQYFKTGELKKSSADT